MYPRRTLSASLVLAIALAACGPAAASPTVTEIPSPSPPASVSPPPSASVAPSTSPVPVHTLTPTELPAAFADWRRIDLPDPAPGVFGGGTPADVIWFNGQYVAVGTIATECCADSDPSRNVGVIWTSGDGRSWRLRDLKSTFEHASLDRLLELDGRLFAVGSFARPTPGDIAEAEGTAWVSDDGTSWLRASGAVGGVPFESGLIGVERTDGAEDSGIRFRYSTDGLTWSYTSELYEVNIRDLVVSPTVGALAIGAVTGPLQSDGTYREDTVIFTSWDGLSWVGPTLAIEGASPRSATATRRGFMIAGWATKPTPGMGNREYAAIWRSDDGMRWEAVPLVVADEEHFNRVYVVGETLIVSGATSVDGSANEMLWVSVDGGQTWGRVADQPAFDGINNEIAAILPTPDGLLAVGRRWDSVSGHPLPEAWWSAP